MKLTWITLLISIIAQCAYAQSVQQSGNVTPGHAACWAITGVVYDCGAPGGGVSVVGSTTQNDLAAFNGSGSLIDSGINPANTTSISGLWHFNGGATAPTRSPGDNTTNVATTAFVNNFLSTGNIWTGLNYFTGTQTATQPAVQFGSTSACNATWLFNYTDPCGAYVIGYSPLGTGAAAWAMRSSDYNATTAPVADLIASQVYGIHDNISNAGYAGVWTNYWVGWRTATAYAPTDVQILEASFLNAGSAVQANPVYLPDGVNDPVGSSNGITVDCGVGPPPAPQGTTCTTAFQAINNSSAFYTILRATINSVVPSNSGYYEAIQLSSNPTGTTGPGHAIVWYTGTPCAHPCSPAGLAISGVIEVDDANKMRLIDATGLIYTAATNDALFFGGHNNLASGGIIASVNDAGNTFKPLEIEGTQFRFSDNGTTNALDYGETTASTWTFSKAVNFANPVAFTGGIPSLSNGIGSVSGSATFGAILTGKGSSFDVTVENGSAAAVCTIGTGTTTWGCVTVAASTSLSLPDSTTWTSSGLSALTVSGLLRSTFGTPTIAMGACGTGTNGTIAGTNQSGLITIGASATATCTVSFSTTLTNAPNACVAFPANAGAAATGTTVARVSSITTGGFVITGSALASSNYYYLCI